MKLTVLIENTSSRPDLSCQHGLSLYIETRRHRILFDSGQTDLFAENATRLGIDLSRVDLMILSHGHYDHGGGISAFLELNSTAPVYLSRHAFGDYYNGTEKYIGLDKSLAAHPRIHFVDDQLIIDEELSLHSCNNARLTEPIQAYGLKMNTTLMPDLIDTNLTEDTFRHEQYLLIQEDHKRFLISGCSHKGIINIETLFTPDVLIGGFHLSKVPVGDPALGRVANALMSYPTTYYTGHCTGGDQYKYLKSVMGEQLHSISTGDTLHL